METVGGFAEQQSMSVLDPMSPKMDHKKARKIKNKPSSGKQVQKITN